MTKSSFFDKDSGKAKGETIDFIPEEFKHDPYILASAILHDGRNIPTPEAVESLAEKIAEAQELNTMDSKPNS